MNSQLTFMDIVVEFPENDLSLTVSGPNESGYEYVVLSSSYKPTASYLFRWFKNMQSSCNKENAEEKIQSMVEVFDMHKDQLFVSLREYVLIEGILQTSFRMRLDNSHLVCEVLNLAYRCWSSFGPLHFKAILGRRARAMGGRSTDLLAFFLDHARIKKLQYNGVRMIDVSIYSCIRKAAIFLSADVWSWQHLLIYLQYGAKFEKLHQDPSTSQYGVALALTETLRTLITHLWYRLVYPGYFLSDNDKEALDQYCSALDADVANLCRTFNVLLRATRRIPHRSLDFVIRDSDDRRNDALYVHSRNVMGHCSISRLVPKFRLRYVGPDELRHVCRWVIRKRLNENWELPHGIRRLPVPLTVQQYLNLLVD